MVRIFEGLKGQPGFVSARLNVSLGQPRRYHTLHRWESAEAFRRFRASSACRELLDAHPLAGLAEIEQPYRTYDLVYFLVNGPGDYISRWFVSIQPGRQAAFEASRTALFDLQRRLSPGFAHHGLYRYLGNQTDYMLGLVNTSPDGLRDVDADPEIAEFLKEHPLSGYLSAPPIEELSVTVQRI